VTRGERAVADVARGVRDARGAKGAKGFRGAKAVKKGNDAAENWVCGGVSWSSSSWGCRGAFLLGLACVEKLMGSLGRNLNLMARERNMLVSGLRVVSTLRPQDFYIILCF